MDNENKTSLRARLASFFGRVWRAIVLLFRRIRDRKTHVYRRCPVCKTVLRLARTPGDKGVNCPSCRGHFSVKIK